MLIGTDLDIRLFVPPVAIANQRIYQVPLARIERATLALGVPCSVLLSYRGGRKIIVHETIDVHRKCSFSSFSQAREAILHA